MTVAVSRPTRRAKNDTIDRMILLTESEVDWCYDMTGLVHVRHADRI